MTERERVVDALRPEAPPCGQSDDEATDDRPSIVLLVVDAEAGVRRFTLTVGAPDGALVTAVVPGDLREQFEVVEGGGGADGVTARAVDFVGAGRDPPVVLFGVRFDEPVRPEAVDVFVDRLIDHAEADADPDRLAVEPAPSERL